MSDEKERATVRAVQHGSKGSILSTGIVRDSDSLTVGGSHTTRSNSAVSDSNATAAPGESVTGNDDNQFQEQAGPRERVLQAALELFVEQGYFNTNVPDISKRSRCSVGSIYHHFLNKEDIATQLYRDGMLQFRQALQESILMDDSLESAIQKLVCSFLTFAQTNYLLSRYLWLARHSEFLSGRILQPTVVGFDDLGRKLTKIIKKAIRLGEIPELPAHVIWTIVFGIPVSYIRDWLDGYASAQPSDVADTLARASWAALHGAA